MPYTYADPEVAFTLDLPDGEIQLIYHTYRAMQGDRYAYWYATDMTETDHSEFDIRDIDVAANDKGDESTLTLKHRAIMQAGVDDGSITFDEDNYLCQQEQGR